MQVAKGTLFFWSLNFRKFGLRAHFCFERPYYFNI